MNLAAYKQHQEFFNNKAETLSISENQIGFIRGICELIGFDGNETVLDIGCGTGRLLKILDSYLPNGKILGIDFAYNMLKKCPGRNKNARFRLQSLAEQLPLRNSMADIVLNYCLYPHLKYKQTALREFHRVLKPGGKYYIIHPEGSHEVNCIHNKIGGAVCYDFIEPIESVVAMLQINGFDVLEVVDEPEKFLIKSIKPK